MSGDPGALAALVAARRELRELCAALSRAGTAPAPEQVERIFERLDADYRASFALCKARLAELTGPDFRGVYLAGGSNTLPCSLLGGSWELLGLFDGEGGEQELELVRKAGFTPISRDLALGLPSIPQGSRDVVLIKDPGNRYPLFWVGLWRVALWVLRPGGIVVTSLPRERARPRGAAPDPALVARLGRELAPIPWEPLPEPPAIANLDGQPGRFELTLEPLLLYRKLPAG